MAQQQPPFDPNALAKWVVDGLKETVAYRIRQTFNRERLAEFIRARLPTKMHVFHSILRTTFEQNGFKFETINHGDASFHLIRKRYREVAAGAEVRRFVLIPGFGDSPASWIPSLGLSHREFQKKFDELIILDFPGYMGFLSQDTMAPSMAVLLSVVKTVCEMHPPTVLMGHSLGGWLSAKIAQEIKKPLEHLILISPSGLTPEADRKAWGDHILNTRNLTIDELIQHVIHDPKRYHHLVRDDLKKFYSKKEVKEFITSVREDQFIRADQPFHARKLSVVWGENDRFVPAHWLRYWAESYGYCLDAYVLKETGHIPQLECPLAFTEVLLNALNDKKEIKGKGWAKVNSRAREHDPVPVLHEPSGVKLLSS